MTLPSPKLGLLVVVALGLDACTDNVGCVFTTGGCQDPQGPISTNEAVLPIDGEWIADARPEIEIDGFFPSGAQNPGTTPVVLVFSESMQGESLQGAFEIVPQAGMSAGRPLQGVAQALVSAGRVLVLLPPIAVALEAGAYSVRLAENAVALDLTGQELDEDPGAELGTFTVVAAPPAAPRVVTTFPADDAVNQSETTEIVVVFDRLIDPQSVDGDSFDVRVNMVDPLFDPSATALPISGGADTRVFLYRSLRLDGQPASLGQDATVELRLSPAGEPISEPAPDGGILVATTITFDTLPFSSPLGASLLSDPFDAIGLANLTDANAEELMVEVDLDAAQANDQVDLFLFGVQKDTAGDPLVALQPRTLQLSGPAPIQSVIFTRENVDLLRSNAANDARFDDGAVTFAFRLRRGSVSTPLRLLDLDPDPDTIQDPLLDTTVPTLETLVGSATTAAFRSDLRGLSLAGTSDEDLRSVEVTTPLGNNGALAPVVGTSPTGTMNAKRLFLAAPAAFGLLANGQTTYTVVARDQAQNAGDPLDGTFTQLGAVGPVAFSPGDSITVEAFDSRDLAVLPGALVLVHSDRGNGVDFPFFGSGTTDPDGRVTLTTEGAPSVGAIVTVVLATYDLFTLHGVPSTHISVPLRKVGRAPGTVAAQATSTDPGVLALLDGLDLRFDDSRRPVEEPRGFSAQACLPPSGGVLVCPHLDVTIRDATLGAHSFFAGDFSQTEAAFQSSQLLRAFALLDPLAPVAPGGSQSGTLEVPFLLDDPATAPEEAAQAVPAFTFQVDPAGGVDLGTLKVGAPFTSVDTLVPGLPGSIAVGLGLAFDQVGGDRWTIRAAFPGAVTAAGSLGSDGRVDTDPFVRVEVSDTDGITDGNTAGVRPRLSDIPATGPPAVFRALAVPAQLSPAAGAQSGGQSFTLLLTHAIADDRPEPGLYRVELVDTAGRGWVLWRFDQAGTADVEIRVVDVGDAGGVGLLDGDLDSTASAFAWSSLAGTDFLWSDVEREFELFSRAATLTFQKP